MYFITEETIFENATEPISARMSTPDYVTSNKILWILIYFSRFA